MVKNRILFFSCLIGSGVVAGIYGGAASHYLFYTFLFLLLLDVFCTIFYVFLRFCIYQQLDTKTMVKEEEVNYIFKLSNEDWIPYTSLTVTFYSKYVTIGEMEPVSEFALLPKEFVSRNTTLCCHCRGEYNVGIDRVVITDLLHMMQFSYRCRSQLKVVVLPRILHLEHLLFAKRNEDDKKQNQIIMNQMQYLDSEVRNYQSGDSMKLVHWKATARRQALSVRKYLDDAKERVILISDFSPIANKENAMFIEDQMIETLLAIIDYYARNHIMTSVMQASSEVEFLDIHSAYDVEEYYKKCCRIRFISEVPIHNLVRLTFAKSSIGTQLVILTEKVTKDLLLTLNQFTRLEHDIIIIAFTDDNIEYDFRGSSNIRIITIHSVDRISDVLDRE